MLKRNKEVRDKMKRKHLYTKQSLPQVTPTVTLTAIASHVALT